MSGCTLDLSIAPGESGEFARTANGSTIFSLFFGIGGEAMGATGSGFQPPVPRVEFGGECTVFGFQHSMFRSSSSRKSARSRDEIVGVESWLLIGSRIAIFIISANCTNSRFLVTNDVWQVLLCQSVDRAIGNQLFQFAAFVLMPVHLYLLVLPTVTKMEFDRSTSICLTSRTYVPAVA